MARTLIEKSVFLCFFCFCLYADDVVDDGVDDGVDDVVDDVVGGLRGGGDLGFLSAQTQE
jgi:hypothetical protein